MTTYNDSVFNSWRIDNGQTKAFQIALRATGKTENFVSGWEFHEE